MILAEAISLNEIQVLIGSNLNSRELTKDELAGPSEEMREVVGAERSYFFPGDEDEHHRSPRSR
jgi:hypothetical protein